jgi:hypothetical protein
MNLKPVSIMFINFRYRIIAVIIKSDAGGTARSFSLKQDTKIRFKELQLKPARLRILLSNASYCVTSNTKTKKTVFKKRLYCHHNLADTKTELHSALPSHS